MGRKIFSKIGVIKLIEEIKKEIEENRIFIEDDRESHHNVVYFPTILKILDKYATESNLKCERTDCAGRIGSSKVFEEMEKYKSMWEEFKDYYYLAIPSDIELLKKKKIYSKINELEQKHGINKEVE